MSSLTENRNTLEWGSSCIKLHRIFPENPRKKLFIGAIAALDPKTGLVEPAINDKNLIVLGRVEEFNIGRNETKRVVIKTGIFCYDNAEGHLKLTLGHINRMCMIVDDHTVGCFIPGITNLRAGIMRDISPDGQIVVELGLL